MHRRQRPPSAYRTKLWGATTDKYNGTEDVHRSSGGLTGDRTAANDARAAHRGHTGTPAYRMHLRGTWDAPRWRNKTG